MTPQALAQGPGIRAWVSFLRAHSALTRALNADLLAEHGLTINDYEVLLHLARAPDQRLRRVDLSQHLLLTASGITRLLDGLERAGYVAKARCPTDQRVSYAVLTEEGLDKLRGASKTHIAGIGERFESRFSEDEIRTLGALLERLPGDGPADAACEP